MESELFCRLYTLPAATLRNEMNFFEIQFTEAAARIHGGTPIRDNGSCQFILQRLLPDKRTGLCLMARYTYAIFLLKKRTSN